MINETEIIQVTLPNGAIAHMEATVIGKPLSEGEEERRIAFNVHSFDGALSIVEGMASAVWSALKTISPHKASVEFGFEVGLQNGELTGLFVKGTGKGNLNIKLEWDGRDQELEPDAAG